MNHDTTAAPAVEAPGFTETVRIAWRRLPDKGLFFGLLAAWLALFHLFGNATFGYVDSPSLPVWMARVYSIKTPVSDDGHGLLIPFVVLGLMWWKREELLSVQFKSWWPGLLITAVALLMHIVGYVIQQPRVSILALFTGIYGLMGLVWGPGWLKRCFFPFFLFAFCVPMGSLTEPITFPLRLMVTKIVAFIGQHLLGIDVISEGTRLLKMPWQYEYEVAAACSGIRSLVAITAIALIYAFVAFRTVLPRALIIFLALPLAILGNTVRMLTIVVAAELGGQSAGSAAHDNTFLSIIPYVPAIGGLLLVGGWMEKKFERRDAKSPRASTPVKD